MNILGKSLLLFLAVWFGCNPLKAQDRILHNDNGFFERPQTSVLVVPFEDKMFLSDLNKQFGDHHGMSYGEIRSLMREALCQMVAGAETVNGYNLLEGGEKDRLHIADFHGAIRYDYVLPKEDKKTRKSALANILPKKEKQQTHRGVSVTGGQVKSDYDGLQRYMNAALERPAVFSGIQEAYAFDYLISINELDIKNNKPEEFREKLAYNRTVSVHYTIFDNAGVEVKSGLAQSTFDFEKKDLFEVSRESFELIGKFICSNIVENEAAKENVTETNLSVSKPKPNQKRTRSASPERKENRISKVKKPKTATDEDF